MARGYSVNMTAEHLLVCALVVAFIATITGNSMCPDVFGLHNVCSSPGEKTAFHCLIYSDTDKYPVLWECEPDAVTTPERIADNERVKEGLRHKYEADIFDVNRTHSCAQLAINVDQDDPDKAYYKCAFEQEEHSAQLRISKFNSGDLKACLYVTERDGEEDNSTVLDIVAAVTDYWGIPGLKLKLYVYDEMVKMVPSGSLKCEESTHAYLNYSLPAESDRDLKIKLTYTHRSLVEEKTLNENVYRNRRRHHSVPRVVPENTDAWKGIAVVLIVIVCVLPILTVLIVGLLYHHKCKTSKRDKEAATTSLLAETPDRNSSGPEDAGVRWEGGLRWEAGNSSEGLTNVTKVKASESDSEALAAVEIRGHETMQMFSDDSKEQEGQIQKQTGNGRPKLNRLELDT